MRPRFDTLPRPSAVYNENRDGSRGTDIERKVNVDWQGLLTGGVVLAAAAYVGVRVWQSVSGRAKAGCGSGCDTCPANKSSDALEGFVSLNDVRGAKR